MVVLTTAAPSWRLATSRLGARLQARLVFVAQVVAMLVVVAVAGQFILADLALVGLALLILGANGLFGPSLELSSLDRLPKIFGAFAAATGVMAAVLALFGSMTAAMSVLALGPLAMLGSFIAFAVSYRGLKWARKYGLVGDAVVVLGAGQVAEYLRRSLEEQPQYGLHVVGHVSKESDVSGLAVHMPRLGDPDEIIEICRRAGASTVIVAFSNSREAELLGHLHECARNDLEVLVVPRFFENLDRGSAPDGVWGVPLDRLPRPAFGAVRVAVKRVLDLILAGAAFVMLLPVMAVCAIAVKRETGGVLFRQVRIGMDERPIEILKFQTLKPATDAESATMWNISHDDRLGPVGKFLRRTSLDELPQLWNVLRGDMSLVGPRPERPHFVDEFKSSVPNYGHRHRVPVGLTGWAQVHELRGDSSIADRARFDNVYAASWTPWEDVKIMLRTIPEVIKGSGG